MTYQCSINVGKADESILDTIDGYYKAENEIDIAGLSKSVSTALSLSHPVLWNCAYAYMTELTHESTYVSFSTLAHILKTVRIWVIQDQRVFENLINIYFLWKIGTGGSEGEDNSISLVFDILGI